MRVLVSGGGTGGHLVPGLNLLRELRAPGNELHLVRPGRTVEERFLRGLEDVHVHEARLPDSGLALPFALTKSLVPARRLLQEARIDIVVGLGGRGSVPSALAAYTQRIPFVLLEQNVVPGRAVKWLARLARRVFTSFPETVRHLGRVPAVATGMPLVRGLGHRADPAVRQRFAGDAECLVVVVGGSQGAEALNRALPRLFAKLPEAKDGRVAIVHIAGQGKEAVAARAYAEHGLRASVQTFVEDMPRLYAAADFIVCRGGGTTLVEVAAASRPAVVVPYPWHRDRQQFHNAEWFERRGAMHVLDQKRLESGEGVDVLARLVRDRDERVAMGERGRLAVPIDAGPRIARDLRTIASESSVSVVLESTVPPAGTQEMDS
ncbi:MAG: UDP-N-acetylglucosamine--N-acetylmuramyl-(pentapeptide) pyrophosphoryl-undecaprenol N-acetylglucosamine transferase [Planctomycetes bacterium]|nr:UDP-N-acetylglucosamine--N-acetylmuramyl-(pentapeptide) pyrophosphoryl-undecaprenol N-acetylglucosamine transferase [Planctomycetota bacterium]